MSQNNRPLVVVSWSSGKDCAFALHQIRTEGRYEVAGLLTTLSQDSHRVAVHDVREELLNRQVESLGLPVERVMLPVPCDNQTYRQKMGCAMDALRERGVQHVAFGDLLLEDVRRYREQQMQCSGLVPLFPLWRRDTAGLSREMVESGLQAIVTCVDQRVLPVGYAGRHYDHDFLDDLPAGVDPCGENGEFHSLVTDGPMFSRGIPVQVGETTVRGNFAFADILLGGG